MATQLKAYTFRKRGRPTKYDWTTWSNGHPWMLEQGVDFHISIDSMRTCARAYAVRNDLKVETSITENGKALVLRFTPKHTK